MRKTISLDFMALLLLSSISIPSQNTGIRDLGFADFDGQITSANLIILLGLFGTGY